MDSVDLAGGLALQWLDDLHVSILKSSNNLLHILVDAPLMAEACFLSLIYGPTNDSLRLKLLDQV